jgi:uncharacterized protein YpmS
MWFRALLVTLLIYLAVRYVVRVLHPRDTQRQVRGAPRMKNGQIDESRIQDAKFKDLPDK